MVKMKDIPTWAVYSQNYIFAKCPRCETQQGHFCPCTKEGIDSIAKSTCNITCTCGFSGRIGLFKNTGK